MNGTFDHVLLHPYRRRQRLRRKLEKAMATGEKLRVNLTGLGEAARHTREQIETAFVVPAEHFRLHDEKQRRCNDRRRQLHEKNKKRGHK